MLDIIPFLTPLISAVTWACMLVAAGERLIAILVADLSGRDSNRKSAGPVPLVAGRGRPINIWGERIEARSVPASPISSYRNR